MRSGYGSGVGRARFAALVTTLAAAAPAHAAAQTAGEPTSLGAAFEEMASTAAALDVDPPTWFPVRGTIDFGEADARFGVWRGGHRHEGQDVFADPGTPLAAVREGVVVETGDDGGRGNYIAIWSPEADRTFVYLHMLRPTPHGVGDVVKAGARVGAVGCTGSCWGDHLHLEMRAGRGTTGRALDPLPLLRRLAKRARPGRKQPARPAARGSISG
jgi:murein DD-endopeptidase MepM/ murein hydrolase activator NlpD